MYDDNFKVPTETMTVPQKDEWVAPENPCPVADIPPFDWKWSTQASLPRYMAENAKVLKAQTNDHGADAVYYLNQEYESRIPFKEQGKEVLTLTRQQGYDARGANGFCPLCGKSRLARKIFVGTQTGIRVRIKSAETCICTMYRRYFSHWCNTSHVGTKYRDITWEKVKTPQYRSRFLKLSDEFLELVFKAIEARPHPNLMMIGPAGVGKTTIMCALYERELMNWSKLCYEQGKSTEAVWMLSALQLANEHLEWERRKFKGDKDDQDTPNTPPTVTLDKVTAALGAGFVPCVYLSEFDKYKKSEFQTNFMHEIIDAVQRSGGQVVVDSNMGYESLKSDLGPVCGAAIFRRLTGTPWGIRIEFSSEPYKAKVYINDSEVKLVGGLLYDVARQTLVDTSLEGIDESTCYLEPSDVEPVAEVEKPLVSGESSPAPKQVPEISTPKKSPGGTSPKAATREQRPAEAQAPKSKSGVGSCGGATHGSIKLAIPYQPNKV